MVGFGLVLGGFGVGFGCVWGFWGVFGVWFGCWCGVFWEVVRVRRGAIAGGRGATDLPT